MKTTREHKQYWKNRKIDWEQAYLSTWDHPHREMIVWALTKLHWLSLWEVGCGPGPNLKKILTRFGNKQLGGSDISDDAIALAQKTFIGGRFHVESVEDMLLSDNAVDVILSDATLIYIDPKKIDKAMNEITRITRKGIVFCEFHSTSWWKRLKLRWKSGYNAYDYRKLLEQYGFYDIEIHKIPKELWPGTPWEEWGHIIIAKKP